MKGFLEAEKEHFSLNGEPIILRGWSIGSWMNFEHFMIGMPGTNSMIINAFAEVYGENMAKEFVHKLLECMVQEDDFAYLKSIGVNSIRIPFGYHYLMDDLHPGVFREEGFAELKRVVELCEKYELFVILDLHSVPGSQNTDWHSDNLTGQQLFWQYECFQQQAIWLWEEVSKRFASNPWVAGYDVLNEPGYGLTSEQINGFYSNVISAIRKNDQNHILFLEGINFGRDFRPLQKLDDPQIAYTVHFYPFVLDDDILNPKMDDGHREQIFNEIFDRQLGEVRRFNRPIWCGESGYEIQDGQEEFYAKLLINNINICEERGISWNLWTYKDSRVMGISIPKHSSNWMNLYYTIGQHWVSVKLTAYRIPYLELILS